jgi:hypothetical protein
MDELRFLMPSTLSFRAGWERMGKHQIGQAFVF